MGLQGDKIEVVDNPEAHRYEATVDGQLSVIAYRRTGDRITFTHTAVPPELEGHGIAARMAQVALEDARARHLEVVPLCPYVAAYIRRHREYLDLLSPEGREHLLGS